MINKLKYLLQKHRTLLLYGAIGLTGALIDLLFFLFFHYVLRISPSLASFLSVSIGILNNFIINSRYNFNVSDKLIRRFLNFYLIGLGGAIASSLIIFILYNGLGIDATIAKIITIPPVVLTQYILNKKLSFQDNHTDLIVVMYSFIKRGYVRLILILTLCTVLAFFALYTTGVISLN